MNETIQGIINRDIKRINQSKIKRLTSSALCPKRYYLEEITGDLKRETTLAMLKGHYFEYQIWGTLPKEGHIPALPLLKNGNKSTDQQRIDLQVAMFPIIMARHGIKVIKTNFRIEVKFNGDIIVFGTLDALVEYKGKRYIMDLKLTANVTSTFGDFAWGSFTTLEDPDIPNLYTEQQDDNGGNPMDVIQAHAYMYDIELLTGKRWGFLYAVFDYKPKSEYKIIEIKHSDEKREQLIERIHDTKYKLNLFKELNYQALPSEWECKSCKAFDCTSRYIPEDSSLDGIKANIPLVQEKLIEVWDDAPW